MTLQAFTRAWICLLLLPAFAGIAAAQVNVYTRSYNNARSGANLNETILTPANVNSNTFGKLFTVHTDGEVYAQPLYVANLSIAGGTHNVVFVATMLNSVYAIDADTGASLWTQNFGTPINAQQVESDENIDWTTGIGILSTPVIDSSTGVMYFVSGNESQVNGSNVYQYHLNAIEIATGLPVSGSPMNITATYSTPDLVSPLVFNPVKQNQRAGLALANGNVYIAFASHEDQTPYSGWVLAYSESTLAQTAVYSDTTIGVQGGIWNAGQAPAVDANGNLYLTSGNGSFGITPNNLAQTGNSFIKLSPTLELLDYFTPSNSSTLNANDEDLGSAGVMLMPNTSYVVGGGKQGVLYLVNTGDMGKFDASSDQVSQEFQAIYGVGTSHIHGTPVYFDSDVNGPTTYVWGENDVMRAFVFNPTTNLFNSTPFAKSTMTAPATNNDGAMPGGFLSISGNGNQNGIVWASTPYNGNAVHQVVQGVLYAFNADTLQLLWTDKTNDARDEIGLFAKFVPPLVANGKVYVPNFGPVGPTTGSGSLVVYGLLNPSTPAATPVFTPAAGTYSTSQSVTITDATSGASIYYTTNGTTPTTSSTLYTKGGIITVSATETLKAIAAASGYSNSAVATAAYTITTVAATPALSVPTGSYNSVLSVTITDGTPGASIYYTTNSTTPTTGSSLYAGPISISSTETLKAIAVASGYSTSAAAMGVYTISLSNMISQAGWTLKYVDSQETVGENAPATNAFDGHAATYWHTQWDGANPPLPHEIQINLGASYSIDGFTYLPRQDGCSHGTVGQYQFYVSTDGVNWGNPVAAGTFNYGSNFTYGCPGGSVVPAFVVNFPAVTASYVRFRGLSEMGGNPWTSVAELNVMNAPATQQPVSVTSLTLSPNTLLSGGATQGTVNLNAAAPSGGTVVTLSSSNTSAATAPASVTVPAGQTSATFSVATTAGASATVTLKASTGTSSASATLTVQSMVPLTGWTLEYVDSQETVGANTPATNAFDGNPNSFWHTEWYSASPPPPHEIEINLGASYTLNGFTYLPRQDGCSHGTVGQYQFYVSTDGVNWGNPVAAGTFNYGSNVTYACGGGTVVPAQQVNFSAVTGQYIRFVALTEVAGNPWTSAAEIHVLH